MTKTIRSILTEKGFDFEKGIIGKSDYIETKKDKEDIDRRHFTGATEISNSDPILNKAVPFNDGLFLFTATDEKDQMSIASDGKNL